MNNTTELPVAQYLKSLSVNPREFAYLGLDINFCINKVAGATTRFGIENVKTGGSAVEQLSFLESILPGDRKPVVIPNAQYMKDRFVDLHLFGEPGQQWLLFIDQTEQGKLIQQAQQVRLEDDITKERLLETRAFSLRPASGDNVDGYYLAIERLMRTYADSLQSVDEKLHDLLQQGLEYFELDTALLSCVSGNTATLKVVVSMTNSDTLFKVGDVLPADDVPCSHIVDETSHLAISDVSEREQSTQTGFTNAGIKSCIAAPVQTKNGPFGSVCFYSTKSRSVDFSEKNVEYLLLTAGLLANLQGYKEQLGFIQAQSENYKNLFESVPAVMFLCDIDGLVISVSELFSAQVGIERDLVPGKICLEFFGQEYQPDVRKAIQNGNSVAVPAELLRREKPPLEVELNVKEKRFGAMAGIRMVIATDVSDRNQALRNVTDQNRMLQNANDSLDQFAYVASHDLQEPLRKIQQFGSLLEEDMVGKLDDDGKYYLEVIVKASKRMSALIKDILNFSRAKKEISEQVSIKLNPFLNDLIAELDVPFEKSGGKILINDLPTVQASAPLLSQLFNNLIGNAVKYHKPDEPPIVRIWAEELSDGKCINVADNGIGFDMKYAKQIFEPFSRLQNSQAYDGTGIGLAICNTVCEKHGWILSAHSELGVGSTFRIQINDKRAVSG